MIGKGWILHKVKAHQTKDEIIGNKFADKLAKRAVAKSLSRHFPTPWFNFINSSCVRRNSTCYGPKDPEDLWDLLDPG